jgi:hypothetical protein
LKNATVHLVGFFNSISKSGLELTQYYRLKDISMQKVEIPQGNAWIFSPTKIFLKIHPDRIKKKSHSFLLE